VPVSFRYDRAGEGGVSEEAQMIYTDDQLGRELEIYSSTTSNSFSGRFYNEIVIVR
jgi:hypothetical protein